jgi:membrane protein implicated in regulation of membrane protease activity
MWIWAALVFLIIEMFTATFYGLSVSLAAGIVAIYVAVMGDQTTLVIHGIIFAVASVIFSIFLPKMLTPTTGTNQPQGMDRYTGEVRSVKKSWGEYKISLDGVEYVIECDSDVVAGDKVSVLGSHGTAMHVKKV